MSEHPILFSAPMVRAILSGKKSQTRRPVGALSKNFPFGYLGTREPQPTAESFHDSMQYGWLRAEDGVDAPLGAWLSWCPYGVRGDRLFVRENGWERPERTPRMMRDGADTWEPYYFDATMHEGEAAQLKAWGFKRRPSIHMPRRFCRLTLEVLQVDAQRLNSISERDAEAEGVMATYPPGMAPASFRNGYASLWETLNGRGSWSRNPWVWVVTFRAIKA